MTSYKYFNTKILQHCVCNSVAIDQGEETYRESNCHGRDFRKEMYSRLPRISSMGGCSWRVVGMRKGAQKRFRSIRSGCEKGIIIGHLTRKVSRVCSLFLRWRGSYCRQVNKSNKKVIPTETHTTRLKVIYVYAIITWVQQNSAICLYTFHV